MSSCIFLRTLRCLSLFFPMSLKIMNTWDSCLFRYFLPMNIYFMIIWSEMLFTNNCCFTWFTLLIVCHHNFPNFWVFMNPQYMDIWLNVQSKTHMNRIHRNQPSNFHFAAFKSSSHKIECTAKLIPLRWNLKEKHEYYCI